MNRPPITIGLLAGGVDDCWDGLTVDGSKYKAMVGIAGRPMWELVAGVIPKTNNLMVVGEWVREDHSTNLGQMLCGTGNLLGNIMRIIKKAETELVLFITCDLPALTRVAVEDFIWQCSYYPEMGIGGVVVSREKCMERFPEVPRTFVKFSEGDVTFGNLIMMRKSFAITHQEEIRSAYESRKSPFALAALVGWDVLGKFALAQTISRKFLSTDEIVGRLSTQLSVDIRLFVSQYPEVAEDVDKIKHLVPMLKAMHV